MKIIKPYPELRIYQVVDEAGNVIREFDDYNHQAPLKQAREWLRANS